MEMIRVWAVWWSPTGTTERVVRALAEQAAESLAVPLETLDITRPSARVKRYSFTEKDLVIFGVPTYAGKTPNKLLPDLQGGFSGGGALAAPVVTFGNRSYDNALAELAAVLEGDGFHTVAAAAFASRHAFTDELGYGRPDLPAVRRFGKELSDKVKRLTDIPPAIQAPGDPAAPYYVPRGVDGQPAKFLKAKPQTDLGKCTGCGVCARACPMGAIDPRNVAEVPGTCIKCQSCVRRCTRHAKYFDDPAFLSHVAMLEAEFAEPKEDAVFL